MKKLVLFTILVLLQQLATAQTRRDIKDFSYGFKAAWNVATVSHSDISDAIKVVSQHKLAAGGFAMYRPFDDFAISAELLYSQQGCRFEIPYINQNPQQDDIGYTNDAKFEFQCLNVPILVNWYVPIVPGLAVKSGVQPGFLLESKHTYWGETIDFSEWTESVDISIPIGLSYELDFGLIFDIRYNIGLTNVITDDREGDVSGFPNHGANATGINYTSNASNTNSVWQLSVGLRF